MTVPTTSTPRTISETGVRMFEAIADRWRLTTRERETILGMPRSTYARVRSRPQSATLDRNTLERISHVAGIYKALHVLFPNDEQADTWIDRPSTDFGGAPARERLTTGLVSDLTFVRHYLDVARG